MHIFLDTASVEEIQQASRLGVLSGITTNPSLAAKEGISDFSDYRHAILEIASIIDGPISAEVVALEAEAMIEEGTEIALLAPKRSGQASQHPGGPGSHVPAVPAGDTYKSDIMLLAEPGIAGRQSGSLLYEPLRRPPG